MKLSKTTLEKLSEAQRQTKVGKDLPVGIISLRYNHNGGDLAHWEVTDAREPLSCLFSIEKASELKIWMPE